MIFYLMISRLSTFIFLVLVLQSVEGLQIEQLSAQKSDIPARIFAGQIHYSRIPVEYWEHRILMVKALGMNALSIYIMWNYHEISRGEFDYSTQNKNLNLFLNLAEKHGMKVFIRPGPYVCAQWDFGGLPARLMNINGLVIRANNQPYLEQVRIYFQSLVPILKKHMYSDQTSLGSIILLQIENEYGFYGRDKSYIEAIREIWRDLGVECAQYYVDAIQNIDKCYWTGANIGINNGIKQEEYDYVEENYETAYVFGGEIYSGWLTHWYEKWQEKSIEQNQQEYGFLMENNHSYSMYMVHGGTNFGLTAGANGFDEDFDYRGHVTSYDYDAPINQQGSAAPKYLPLRDLIKQYATWPVPDVPDPIPTMTIAPFAVKPIGKILNNLGEGIKSDKIQVFESKTLGMYNQGIVVYSAKIKKTIDYFRFTVHDFGMIYLDGKFLGSVDRSKERNKIIGIECLLHTCQLDIVVEAMGHINFGHQMRADVKGLIEVANSKNETYSWTMYKIPVDQKILNWSKMEGKLKNFPILSKGSFFTNQNSDTYLDMSKFTKGYVWVNGRNLGRYWNVGPQSRLFCPGVWLKSGKNTVHVLEMVYDQVETIEGKKTLK